MPVPAPAVATDGDAELHVPPPVASPSVVVAPTHRLIIPVTGAGIVSTISGLLMEQPVAPRVYMIVTVPAATPVTTPVDTPTLPIAGALLIHVPPGTTSVSVTADPTHTAPGPIIAAGNALTVTITVAAQPVPKV
jgi:hypothetical protein